MRIEQYAAHKRLAFTAIKVKQAIISTSDILVLKIGKEMLDA